MQLDRRAAGWHYAEGSYHQHSRKEKGFNELASIVNDMNRFGTIVVSSCRSPLAASFSRGVA